MSTPRFDILETPIEPGQTLIEASAGTGKTFALTGLVVRLVLEGMDLRRILLVTFTIAATEELTTRVRAGLRDALGAFQRPGSVDPERLEARFLEQFGGDGQAAIDRLEAALQCVDEASVFTIHGFCKRVLEQAAFESGAPFAAEFTDDASELLERAVADFWHRHTYHDQLVATLFLDTDEQALRNHYFDAHRFPGTTIIPEPEDLQALAAELEDALQDLRSEWEDDGERLLRTVGWTRAGFKTQEDAARTLDQVAAALQGEIAGNLKAIGRFTAEAVRTGGYKRGREGHDTTAAAEHPVCRACEAVHDVVCRIEAAIIHRFVTEVDARYRQLREEARQFTFDDLIQRVHEALEPGSPTRDQLLATVRSRWSHALIDEFQDTDPVQYDIFRWAFDGQPLVFVGDPKQSIYRFRGADLFAYIDAKRAARAEYVLGTNWRSATKLVEAVNEVFGAARHPFLFDEIGYEPVRAAGRADAEQITGDGLPPLVWWQLPLNDKGKGLSKGAACDVAVEGVVAEIQRLLADDVRIGERALAPKDVAVLVRENRQAVQLADALRRAGVPSVLSKTGDIFESPEVAELEFVLRAIHRPQDRRAVRTALATDLWGRTASEIAALDRDDAQAAAITEQLRSWHEAWRERGVLNALRRFIDDVGLTARLLRLEDGERRMTNVRHAVELLHQAEVERGRGPDELLRWLRARDHQRLMGQEERELRLESDADAVQLVTVHKSKGLQYEVVFAPFLWSAREPFKKPFPLVHLPGKEGEIVYDLGSDQHERHRMLAQAEDLAEELRLAYVAMTRAKQRCYVAFGAVNFAEASSLAYLLLGHHAADGATYAERAKAAIEAAKSRLVAHGAAALEAFAAVRGELTRVLPVPEKGPRVQLSFDGSGATLRARTFPADRRPQLTPWTHTSFSGLTSAAYEDIDHTLPDGPPLSPAAGLLAFAAGRQAGLCLHEILEEVVFAANGAPSRELEQLVARKLRKYALDQPHQHRAAIDPLEATKRMVDELGSARLPLGAGLLRDLPAESQIREWRFVLPVRAPSPRKLADAFRAHGEGDLGAVYPDLLERLGGDALARYLSGFADLVFEHGGRWYVYDWKSNLLGDTAEAYAGERLAAAAISHHYELQLHLYSLGLHRYLKSRLPDYDYDWHVGGSALVFLRGVRGGTDSGFHARRPPRPLIEALERALCPD